MTVFGDRLKELRTEKGLTTIELGKAIGVTASTITNYESGLRYPKKEYLEAITDYFNVDQEYLDGKTSVRNRFNFDGIYQCGYEQGMKDADNLTEKERNIIRSFRELDKDTQDLVESLIEKLNMGNGLSIAETPAPYYTSSSPRYQVLTMYGIGPSAGSGNFLPDDMSKGEIQVLESPTTKKADYALKVDGHSMEPLYKDGDVVLVQSCETLDSGQIGIFTVDGAAVVKRYQPEDGVLHSINPDYPDIRLDSGDIRIVGKVIGKA